MVSPEEILRKAENLYPAFLRAHAAGGPSLFPLDVPCRRTPGLGTGVAEVAAAVQRLRAGSKECLGYGYTVEWREVSSRRYGRNRFPVRVRIETEQDYLRLVGKGREFATTADALRRLQSSLPELKAWARTNIRSLAALAPDLDGLIEVVAYLRDHPRPDRFARELPLSVDTKFVERHRDVLRRWLDAALPPHTIQADEDHFERRYGLRYAGQQVLVRFLDDGVQAELGFPCDVVGLPLHALGGWRVNGVRVVVVENKVNLLTLPALPRAIGIGGLGSASSLLRYCGWISACPLDYWGDLDVQGLEILSALRALFPHARSVLMDRQTLEAWRPLCGQGTGVKPAVPAHLTAREAEAFTVCAGENVRLEQERMPQSFVNDYFRSLFGPSASSQ